MKSETNESRKLADFENEILPHFDAAYRLARWFISDTHDAEDVTQIAFLRAWKFFEGFRGGDGRTWVLAIVRNTACTRLRERCGQQSNVVFSEEMHSDETLPHGPADLASMHSDHAFVRSAIESLPADFREAIVLREIEDLSYQEIAAVAGIPIGTVMSRLARGRALLREALSKTSLAGRIPSRTEAGA